jgi:hypothetical protein
MIGTLVGLIFLCIIIGFVWWAVVGKLFPLISPYIGQPFMTFIQIILAFIILVVVLYVIATMLGFAGIHVGGPFGGNLR